MAKARFGLLFGGFGKSVEIPAFFCSLGLAFSLACSGGEDGGNTASDGSGGSNDSSGGSGDSSSGGTGDSSSGGTGDSSNEGGSPGSGGTGEEGDEGCPPPQVEGTYVDDEHCLMWESGTLTDKLAAETATDHAAAQQYCENLDYAGYTDWRLPTLSETRTLIEGNDDNAFAALNDCGDDLSSTCCASDSCTYAGCVSEYCLSGATVADCAWNTTELGTSCATIWTDTEVGYPDDYLTGGEDGHRFIVDFTDGSIGVSAADSTATNSLDPRSLSAVCVRGSLPGKTYSGDAVTNGTTVSGATTACSDDQYVMAEMQTQILSCFGMYCADGLYCSTTISPNPDDLALAKCLKNASYSATSCTGWLSACDAWNVDPDVLIWYSGDRGTLVCVSPDDVSGGSSSEGCTTDSHCGPCSRCSDGVCRYCGYGASGLCTC